MILLHLSAAAIGAVQERAGIGSSRIKPPDPGTPYLASLHPDPPQDAQSRRHATASSNDRATPCTTVRSTRSWRNLSCASDSGALPTLELQPVMRAVRPDQQEVENTRPHPHALEQSRRLRGAVLAVGHMRPHPPRLASHPQRSATAMCVRRSSGGVAGDHAADRETEGAGKRPSCGSKPTQHIIVSYVS